MRCLSSTARCISYYLRHLKDKRRSVYVVTSQTRWHQNKLEGFRLAAFCLGQGYKFILINVQGNPRAIVTLFKSSLKIN